MTGIFRYTAVAAGCCLLSACASIDYNTGNKDDLLYFEPQPVLLVTNTEDCKQAVTVLTIPSEPRRLRFKPGYGSSEMNVTLVNGMIGAASQATDLKLPETFGLLFGAKEGKKPVACRAESVMYKIDNGKVLTDPLFNVPPPTQVVGR